MHLPGLCQRHHGSGRPLSHVPYQDPKHHHGQILRPWSQASVYRPCIVFAAPLLQLQAITCERVVIARIQLCISQIDLLKALPANHAISHLNSSATTSLLSDHDDLSSVLQPTSRPSHAKLFDSMSCRSLNKLVSHRSVQPAFLTCMAAGRPHSSVGNVLECPY